ncbi:inositol monophosphatase [Mobilitalea sibirica]|uniref:Inositol-1-monophosphatase n=1 Tax=Mobilitalea sibirica TaxID=1462919 RepID=A0A8J7KWS7_9FIRM|nr:inositol monophosphatase family protein [Mobilitalea sibirica]MBH1940857.1 inositol monophosphatase [Mobilitalea sibirica]
MTEEILKVIKEAGKIILNAHDISFDIESKQGDANFVTQYDTQVQDFLYKELSKIIPNATFIGEEDKNQKKVNNGSCFIIDPIDGTTNFIFDYKHSAISVAFMQNGEIITGYVYNPYLDEVFYAHKGKGAYLNDRPLHMKDIHLKDGIAGFGTSPYYRDMTEQSFALARKLYNRALDIRRSGSAALDICYVAANRYVLFAEFCLSPWDYAAASLIVREAGGNITTMDQQPLTYDKPISILAANPAAYKDFIH